MSNYEPLDWQATATLRKDKAFALLDAVREAISRLPDDCMLRMKFTIVELIKQKQTKLVNNTRLKSTEAKP